MFSKKEFKREFLSAKAKMIENIICQRVAKFSFCYPLFFIKGHQQQKNNAKLSDLYDETSELCNKALFAQKNLLWLKKSIFNHLD